MDLDSLLVSRLSPLIDEILLHLLPDLELVFLELCQLLVGLAFKPPQPVTLLDDRGLDHQVLQLLEVAIGPPPFEVLLDQNCCQLGTTRSPKHSLRIVNNVDYLLLVNQAIDHILH